MTDELKEPYAEHPLSRFAVWRRLAITLSILFFAWVIFAYIAPRLTFPVTSRQPEPVHQQPVDSAMNSRSEEQVEALSARIEQLEAKLKAFEDVMTSAPIKDPEQEERLNKMQEKLDSLEAASGAAPDKAAVTSLETGIREQKGVIAQLKAEIEKLQSANNSQLAINMAFGQLQDAALRGEVFDHHIKQLKELASGRADIQELLGQLHPYSEKTIPTMEELLAGFDVAIPQALSPGVKPDSMLANIKSLVRVRKVGKPEGTDDVSSIARAEDALKGHHVQECLNNLRDLSPPAAAAFLEWTKTAQDFTQGRKLIESLQVALSKAITQTPAQQAPTPAEPATPEPAQPVQETPEIPHEAPIQPAPIMQPDNPNNIPDIVHTDEISAPPAEDTPEPAQPNEADEPARQSPAGTTEEQP